MSDIKHERRVVGHASGWKEHMDTCVCGKPWPCSELPESIRRIECATESVEYKTYGAMAGAAIAGAAMAPTKEAQEEALKQAGELMAKQADVVRRG